MSHSDTFPPKLKRQIPAPDNIIFLEKSKGYLIVKCIFS